MVKIYRTLIVVFFGLITWSCALLAGWQEHITQVEDGLYTAKIADRPLTLVMEKIDDADRALWQHYARVQNSPRTTQFLYQKFPNFSTDGSDHFASVLSEVDPHKNEIWVAYITTSNQARRISKEDVADYSSADEKTKTGFLDNIVMFVTVASSPKAVISSHMGVSASYEGLMRKIRGVSKDLHSFGAKVMLMRNPDRKYMVNAPNAVMGSILASAVPKGSFFAGNKELPSILERRVNEIDAKIQADPEREKMRQDIIKLAQLMAEGENNRLSRAKQGLENKDIDEKKYNEIKAYTLDPGESK